MYKQIIICRKDLQMSHGKMAAQVSHASMAFLTQMIRDNYVGDVYGDPMEGMKPLNQVLIDSFRMDKGIYDEWIGGSFTKVVLQAKNRYHLLKAVQMAEEIGLQEGLDYFLIKDNCYTELTPEEYSDDGIGRTLTCIGFKPMDAEVIDKVAKKYHIYTD